MRELRDRDDGTNFPARRVPNPLGMQDADPCMHTVYKLRHTRSAGEPSPVTIQPYT